MKRYEYKTDERTGNRSDYEKKYLEFMGNDGWELCAVSQPDNPMSVMPIYYYWKREIIDRLN